MSCVQLSEGGFRWLVAPVIRSCQSPTWIWLVNCLHLHVLQPHPPRLLAPRHMAWQARGMPMRCVAATRGGHRLRACAAADL